MIPGLSDLKSFARSRGGKIIQLSSAIELPTVVHDVVSGQYKVEMYRSADLYSVTLQGVWPILDRYLTDGHDLIHGGMSYNDYSLLLKGVDSGGIGLGAEYFRGVRPISELLIKAPKPLFEYPQGVWIHGGSGPAFFGHWLWEFVTKFVVLKMSGRLEQSNCILSTALPTRFLGWLDFLFGDQLKLNFVDPINNPGVWGNVEIISTPIYRSRFDNKLCVASEVLQTLRQMGRERAGVLGWEQSPRNAKLRALWIDRNSPWRNLVNTEEIFEIVNRLYDVDRISMENLSPADQIRAIQPYDLIIGPSGSSMPITIFCSPKSTVLEFFNPRNEGRLAAKLFCDLFGVPHVRVNGEVVGQQNGPTHTDFDYRVDPLSFSGVLSAVLNHQIRGYEMLSKHDFGPT